MSDLQWRILPPDEWPRIRAELPHSPLATLARFEDLQGVVVVVEDGGAIVGHWPLILTWHAEPLYLHPDHQRIGPALRKLIEGLYTTMRDVGVSTALAVIEDPTVVAQATRLGFQPVPGSLYYATAPAPPEGKT